MILTKVPKGEGVKTGMVIILPDTFKPVNTYPAAVFNHGINGVGDGSSKALDLLVNGEIPQHVKDAADVEGFIIACPQTTGDLQDIDNALDYLTANYKITPNLLDGLSYGGGMVWGYIKSSAARAKRFYCASPMATTYANGDAVNIVNAKLPIWAFHNTEDNNGGTPYAASESQVKAVVDAGGMAVLTGFNEKQHGGWDTATRTDAPPVALNGKGFTNPATTVWKWAKAQTATTRTLPAGTSAPGSITADLKASLSGNTLTLDATGSFGYKSAKLAQVSWPKSVNGFGLNIAGGGTEKGTVQLPESGQYVFRVTIYAGAGYTGQAVEKTVTVDYVKTDDPAKPKTYVESDLLQRTAIFSDGSTEYIINYIINVTTRTITLVTEKQTIKVNF